jgi:hypothetical protein
MSIYTEGEVGAEELPYRIAGSDLHNLWFRGSEIEVFADSGESVEKDSEDHFVNTEFPAEEE